MVQRNHNCMNIHKEPRQEEKTQSREGDSEFRVVHWIDGAKERASDLGKCGSLQRRVDKNKAGQGTGRCVPW